MFDIRRTHAKGPRGWHKTISRRVALHSLVTALILAAASTAFAGVAEVTSNASSKTVVPEKKPEANLLCFADGKICFDIQERLRFEARENTFDFNSHLD